MALENMVSISFTADEVKTIKDSIKAIAGVLEGKTQSLTPQERKQYARVKYEKEVWIDNVKIQMDQNPTKIPAYIDKAEFDKDYAAHKQLNELLSLLELQVDKMRDTNLLLGYDLDNSALMFHRVIKTSAINGDPGAVSIYQILKKQFPAGKKKAREEKSESAS